MIIAQKPYAPIAQRPMVKTKQPNFAGSIGRAGQGSPGPSMIDPLVDALEKRAVTMGKNGVDVSCKMTNAVCNDIDSICPKDSLAAPIGLVAKFSAAAVLGPVGFLSGALEGIFKDHEEPRDDD